MRKKVLFLPLLLCGLTATGVFATWQYATNPVGEAQHNVEFIFTFAPPTFTEEQQAAISNFLKVLNDTSANGEFQEVLDYYDGSRNYVNGNDVIRRGNTDNELIYDLGNTDGYFIIKYDRTESQSGDAESFVVFSTPNAVSGYSGKMVQEVYKTIFLVERDENGKAVYFREKETLIGEAPYAYDYTLGEASYNTDFWARDISADTYYKVNLNTNVDEDPSTPVNYNTNNSDLGNFAHFAFTAETRGSYTITTDKACKIGVYSNLADNSWGANLEGTRYKVAGTADATATSLTFTAKANTKYYIRLTMPEPTDGNYAAYTDDYIVQMEVKAN